MNAVPAPCPYCAAPIEAARDTCASCGKPLPPLPHLEPKLLLIRPGSLGDRFLFVMCTLCFVGACVSLAASVGYFDQNLVKSILLGLASVVMFATGIQIWQLSEKTNPFS